MVDVSKLGDDLAEQNREGAGGYLLDIQPIPGEVEVLRISVENREELPIFISVTDDEILCMSYLFKEEEVKTDKKGEMQHAMLAMNIPMPLSSFGKIDDQYVVFGALSTSSNLDDIVHEIVTLSDNTLEAIEAMQDYLK